MRRNLLGWLAVIAFALVGGWALSQPEPPPAGPGMPLVSLEMQKATLRQALEALAKQAPALNFVVRDELLDGEKTLTFRLRNVPADQALMALLRAAGCSVEPIPVAMVPPGTILVASPEGPRPMGMMGPPIIMGGPVPGEIGFQGGVEVPPTPPAFPAPPPMPKEREATPRR